MFTLAGKCRSMRTENGEMPLHLASMASVWEVRLQGMWEKVWGRGRGRREGGREGDRQTDRAARSLSIRDLGWQEMRGNL